MKKFIKNLFPLGLLIAVAAVGAVAQTHSSVRFSMPAETKNQAELISDPNLKELTDLLGDPDVTCRKKEFLATGTISKLYFNDGGQTLSAFEIRDAKNKRYPINLNNDPFGAVGKYSFETIKGVFKEKRKATVSYVACQSAPGTPFDSNYLTKITVE